MWADRFESYLVANLEDVAIINIAVFLWHKEEEY